jgi:PAS domain-containing protein
VGIFDYDVAKNVLVWDEQMFRLYGITKDHFGGVYETWRNDLHPEDRKHANNELKAALRGEKDIDCEFRVRPGRENASSGCSPAPGRLKGRELSERRSPVRTAAVPLCLLR